MTTTASTVPAGARLRLALDQLAPGLAATSARLWSPDCGADRYRAWLRTAHHLVLATPPLLAEASQECLRRADPLSAVLAPYFAHQLTEEYGHDRWLLADYAATGADPAELLAELPGPATARFAGAPYYWIRHVHPLALLGHVALLEWYPPSRAVAAALPGRTGLPASAFHSLDAHAGLDQEHGGRLHSFLDSLTLTAREHRILLTAATTSAGALIEVLGEVLADTPAAPPDEPRRNHG